MSNYIVLVKQVPDVTQITDNAFDPETGTLIRTRLASVINELDSQALDKFGRACITFCQAGVYETISGQLKPDNPSNCLHCKTCQRKCPYDNIRWTVTEGGGPRYKKM